MKDRKNSKWLRRRHQRSMTAANAFGQFTWYKSDAGKAAFLQRRLLRNK